MLCIKNPNVAYTEKACLRGIWNKLWNFFTRVSEDINNSMFDRKFCMDPLIQLPLYSLHQILIPFLECSTLALLNIHCRQCTGTEHYRGYAWIVYGIMTLMCKKRERQYREVEILHAMSHISIRIQSEA
jgi:hypothetical protein